MDRALRNLAGYWAAFALWPAPGVNFDFVRVSVPLEWTHHLTGFAAHWDKNSNLGAAFDAWFLNLWPRPKPFVANGGWIPYAKFSSQPRHDDLRPDRRRLGLRDETPARTKLGRLMLAGFRGSRHWRRAPSCRRLPNRETNLDAVMDDLQRGICFLLLAIFYALIDVRRWRAWAFPLVVIGMNSIAPTAWRICLKLSLSVR
jgi:hypothetical protein